jgi:two-component system, NarL family, response regulator NreC
VFETRVVLADDHGIVRKGLRFVLESEPGMVVVAEASNGREAVRLCEELKPEIAIIDVAMPQMNGIEAVSLIGKVSPNTQSLILSMHADETYILRALSAGAKAYILKDAVEDEILPAVQSVLRGRSYFSPAIAKTLLEDYIRYLRQRGLEDSYDLLTDREKEILQLLAEGRTNKEVANLLGLSVTTIETHRTNLMQKLGLHSTAEIVLYAVRKRIIS